jgi:FAD/FMN-containing dehydrogenase
VGLAGLTLGGGIGSATRRRGWTVDNETGMEVGTADGEIVRASERDNPDLFWALCGGGGNFGVVTGFDYRLFPVGPQIVGGAVAWSGGDTAAVMEMFRAGAARGSVQARDTPPTRESWWSLRSPRIGTRNLAPAAPSSVPTADLELAVGGRARISRSWCQDPASARRERR